jgi:hypothetical protein
MKNKSTAREQTKLIELHTMPTSPRIMSPDSKHRKNVNYI